MDQKNGPMLSPTLYVQHLDGSHSEATAVQVASRLLEFIAAQQHGPLARLVPVPGTFMDEFAVVSPAGATIASLSMAQLRAAIG